MHEDICNEILKRRIWKGLGLHLAYKYAKINGSYKILRHELGGKRSNSRERQRKGMGIIAHTMEYRGDILFSDMKLRNYSDIDYLEYKKIYEDCFFEMRTALGLLPVNCCGKRENLQKKRNKIFILEESGRLIGSIAIYGNEIDDLIVAKEVQGQGYGQSLLKFAICHMQSNGVSPICLHVADWNQKAVRMYLKNGFFITKTEIV